MKLIYQILFLLAFGLAHSFSQSVIVDTTIYYHEVDSVIHEKVGQYGAGQVLLVLDIDNTLLTSDTDLGSDIWYQWQTDKLDLKPLPHQKLNPDCLFNEAICLLFELGTMSLTDSLLPSYIKNWQNSGLTVFALTSRGPQCRAVTERDLQQNGIDLSKSALRNAVGTEIHFDLPADSNLSYGEGIFMTRGANKGTMLADILERSGRTFKAIIVVDDTWKNIANIKGNAAGYGAGEIILFYYTKVITGRLKQNNNVILNPEQAEKMDRDWDELIRTLTEIFPERMEKSECAR
ncbi:MAG: DUF2608 domain-containing protein [Bacteroidales bacterium]|jgi:hypothetical protein|nr:DUF2608 domain-containing protein [Bacteroidales bacterium]